MAWNTDKPYNRKNWKKWAKRNLPKYCQNCGNTGKLEIDHIINLKAGGTDTPDNLQYLCPPCHNKKTQKEAKHGQNKWKKPKEQHPALKAKNLPPDYYLDYYKDRH